MRLVFVLRLQYFCQETWNSDYCTKLKLRSLLAVGGTEDSHSMTNGKWTTDAVLNIYNRDKWPSVPCKIWNSWWLMKYKCISIRAAILWKGKKERKRGVGTSSIAEIVKIYFFIFTLQHSFLDVSIYKWTLITVIVINVNYDGYKSLKERENIALSFSYYLL